MRYARWLAASLLLVSAGCQTLAPPPARQGLLSERAAEAALAQGASLLEQGRPREAIAELQHALRHEPRMYRAHYLLGSCYYELQEYELEAGEYAQCLAINPHYAPALRNLGHCALSLDRLQQARDAYWRYLQLCPRDGQVLYNLALVERDLGRDAVSQELMGRYAKLHEDTPDAVR